MRIEKNIFIAFLLNFGFSIFEFIGGLFTNSVAIISDAVHDIGDSFSILVSYFLEKLSKREPDYDYTYGYIRYSVLGSVITTVILLVGSLVVIYSSIKRFINPVEINYNGMILFAVLGVIVNFLAVYFTKEGDSLNQKSVNLHMLEDVLGWVVVLVGAIFIKYTHIFILDPILSILVAVFIFIHAIKNLKFVIDLFLEKIPNNISINEIKNHLLEIKEIEEVHHIHIWSMDGYRNYATMHVVTDEVGKKIKERIRKELNKHGVSHVTIELESKEEKCMEENCIVGISSSNKHQHHHH